MKNITNFFKPLTPEKFVESAYNHIIYLIGKYPKSENSTQIKNAFSVYRVETPILIFYFNLCWISSIVFFLFYGNFTRFCIQFINQNYCSCNNHNNLSYLSYFSKSITSDNFYILKVNISFLIPVIIFALIAIWLKVRFPISQFKDLTLRFKSLLSRKDVDFLSIEQIKYCLVNKVSLWKNKNYIETANTIVSETKGINKISQKTEIIELDNRKFELKINDVETFNRIQNLCRIIDERQQLYRIASILYSCETIELIDPKNKKIGAKNKLNAFLSYIGFELCNNHTSVSKDIFFEKDKRNKFHKINSPSGKRIKELLEYFEMPEYYFEAGINSLNEQLKN